MKLNNNLDLKNINRILSGNGHYTNWRIISILVIGVMAVSAFLTADFIYKNIYVTLSNANDIVILSSHLSIDTIDLKNYNLAEERKKYKTENFTWPQNIRNIFNYAISASSTTTTKP